jgi:hypothetical protein
MSTDMSTDALAEELKFVEEDLARQPGALRPGDAGGEDDLADMPWVPLTDPSGGGLRAWAEDVIGS